MKRLILALVLMLAAGSAWAGGWSDSYSLTSGVVCVTNTQGNSSWVPVALMWKFTVSSSGTLVISRVTANGSFPLANCTFTNATSMTWIPEAAFPFGFGEALTVTSSVRGGVMELIRKGE